MHFEKIIFQRFCLKMQNWKKKKQLNFSKILGRPEKGKQTFLGLV